MTNETILRNWETILASLPSTAQVSAEFKTFDIGVPYAQPSSSSFDFVAQIPPEFNLNGKHLEKITATLSYKRNNHFYEVGVKLFNDGCVEIEKEFGPAGETAEKRLYPRFYPDTEMLKRCMEPEKAVFMHEWLTNLFTLLGQTPNLRGHYNIGGGSLEKGYETYRPEDAPEAIATRLLAKAKRAGANATAFEAVLERDDAARSDFVDRITITVKGNRRATIEYKSYEKDGFYRNKGNCEFSCAGQYVIGVSHEGTRLKLATALFPEGFPDRKPDDFLVRFNNISEGTCEHRPWPNRQVIANAQKVTIVDTPQFARK